MDEHKPRHSIGNIRVFHRKESNDVTWYAASVSFVLRLRLAVALFGDRNSQVSVCAFHSLSSCECCIKSYLSHVDDRGQ